ncbi:hypothetical protein [Streptomyces sp. NPDC096068]|uniref:hypothetical protein n=1 Tax=Streptomyces sp. NPDC096068 TaxID=3155424 RepID=UPI003327298F
MGRGSDRRPGRAGEDAGTASASYRLAFKAHLAAIDPAHQHPAAPGNGDSSRIPADARAVFADYRAQARETASTIQDAPSTAPLRIPMRPGLLRCLGPGELVCSGRPISAEVPCGEDLFGVGFDDVPQVFVVRGVHAECTLVLVFASSP